jgi:hypothetical protein
VRRLMYLASTEPDVLDVTPSSWRPTPGRRPDITTIAQVSTAGPVGLKNLGSVV